MSLSRGAPRDPTLRTISYCRRPISICQQPCRLAALLPAHLTSALSPCWHESRNFCAMHFRDGAQAMTSIRTIAAALAAAALFATPAAAQGTKVAIGISGWTGFAPPPPPTQAGISARNGLDVTIKKIPQASRHLAIASSDIQCAATTVETWIVWNANGVATTQLFQMDKSYGADGMVVRNDIASIKDVKGKKVAASAPGTAAYFTLA